MTICKVNPATLFDSIRYGFSQAAVDDRSGMIHIAGQVAWDADYQLVGGNDVAQQARQCLANIAAILADQGAGVADILRLRTFIAGYAPSQLEAIGDALADFYGTTPPAPNTIVGVQSLALPDLLVEIEAVAALPSKSEGPSA